MALEVTFRTAQSETLSSNETTSGLDGSFASLAIGRAMRECLDGVFLVGPDRRVRYFSGACARITGATVAEGFGATCICDQRSCCLDFPDRPLAGMLCPARLVLSGRLPSYRFCMSPARQQGKRAWIETTYSPVRGPDQTVVAVLGVMRGVAEGGTARREWAVVGRRRTALTDDALRGSELSVLPIVDLDGLLAAVEAREIRAALARAEGRRSQAAAWLGISRSRLYRRMDQLGILPK